MFFKKFYAETVVLKSKEEYDTFNKAFRSVYGNVKNVRESVLSCNGTYIFEYEIPLKGKYYTELQKELKNYGYIMHEHTRKPVINTLDKIEN